MKQMKQLVVSVLLGMSASLWAADYHVDGNFITIPVKEVKAGGAKVVRLQVINDNIIRVQATSESQLPQKQSLMIVAQKAQPKFNVKQDDDKVCVKAQNVEARVDVKSGKITFYDASGKKLLKESDNGKQFKNFTVPEREYGIKGGAQLTEAMKHGIQWQMKFDSPEDEAFYGLGQHQSEEFNMKGKNEDLFQYNTSFCSLQ